MMGRKAEGDKITVELGGDVEESGYKYSHLTYKDLTIESHHFFTDFDNTPTGVLMKQMLGNLIQEEHT